MTIENIEEEKYLKQIGKAVQYYQHTHPNLPTSTQDRCDNPSEAEIGFLKGRWTTLFAVSRHQTSFHNGSWDGEKLESQQIVDARKSVQEQVRMVKAKLQSKFTLALVTDDNNADERNNSGNERNYFFWALLELILLLDTDLEEDVLGAIKSPTFLSLDFQDGHQMRDIKKMLTHLNTADWSQLPLRILHLINSTYLVEKLNTKDEKDDENQGGLVDYNYRASMEEKEATQLTARLKKMLLFVPCKLLTSALGKKLPWDFFIEYGNSEQWRAEADKVFATQLRQIANLITPVAKNVLGYLWDPISVETKALKKKAIIEKMMAGIEVLPKIDFGTHWDFPILQNIDIGRIMHWWQEDATTINYPVQMMGRIDRIGQLQLSNSIVDIDIPLPSTHVSCQFIETCFLQDDDYECERQRHKSILSAARQTHQKKQQKQLRQPRNLSSRNYSHSRNHKFGGR